MIAAGYADGRLALYCVENGKCLHETCLGSIGVCSMVWMEYSNKGSVKDEEEEKYVAP